MKTPDRIEDATYDLLWQLAVVVATELDMVENDEALLCHEPEITMLARTRDHLQAAGRLSPPAIDAVLARLKRVTGRPADQNLH